MRTRTIFVVILALAVAGFSSAARAELEIRVDKAGQRMAVTLNGLFLHSWAVSTGLGGGPRSGHYRPQRMERKWNSRKYNWAPMPYAIFFHEGYAIHGTTHVRQLGRRASKGCVRLHPRHAAQLFTLVKQQGMGNTVIVIEHGVAKNDGTPRKRKSRVATAR